MTKHVASHITNRPKAYSYVRFSTPEQAKGDSLRRQTQAAERYAALHGLDLDDELTFRDLGVGAFKGANVEIGRLGAFLAAVEHDDIKSGSYLLVESLDRLSRQKPRKAVKVLERICEAGITVVTLDDQRVYTEAVLDDEPWALMTALMVAARANEESTKKGKRVGEAWANKRRTAAEKPLTALCPGWLTLRPDRSAYDLIDDRADTVRRVFDLTLAGRGQNAIAETFNREGVPMFGRGKMWHRTYIAKMLSDRSTIGTHTPHTVEVIDGKKVRTPTVPVEGYFPPVIDRETFDRVSSLSNGRPAQRHREGSLANILGGLARCPQCDATMTRVNKGTKKGGKPYLVCTMAKAKKRCDYRQVRLEDVTATIIQKAGGLFGLLPAPKAELQRQWDSTVAAEAAVSDTIENLTAAIERAGHSSALLNRLRKNEAAHKELKRTLTDLEERIADVQTNRVQETLGRLVDATEAEEGSYDLPMINATLRQLFDKVVIDYLQGYLWLHWKHAPGEVSSLMYAWPKETH
ncbi:MAG: recombinase family protein [Mesorhizobium sp.]|uniref:recombinase family protein n=1 Tax=Mesorhizobium sp. TaxID=1871066 RepID=UPI00122023AC|nr:recombinase family protein [Mesorhizobium sp.]TIO06909.1 MAG: recombinase family protein [Mesorhizobium sp.]